MSTANPAHPACVVVHAGARDHYQVAIALQEANALCQLVTDLYCPDLLRGMLPTFAAKRSHPHLPSKRVSTPLKAMWLEAKMLRGGHFSLNAEKDEALGNFAAALAAKEKQHIFSYSYYAITAFSRERAFPAQKKLLFQLHPHPYAVRKLLQSELETVPQFRDSILHENEFRYDEDYLKRLAGEPNLADAVVVASRYTAKTLFDNGVAEEKVTIVPYGIDSTEFPRKTRRVQNKNLKLLFLGSMVQRKGLSYLLDAMQQLENEPVELVICGRGFSNEQLQASTAANISIRKGISRADLVTEMHDSDLFVFPTLCEGFAHAILEAMSCGLPILATDHCCAPDIITEGKEGFIVPIRDVTALVDRIRWACTARDQLFEMGQAAADTADRLTWSLFRSRIRAFYDKQIQS